MKECTYCEEVFEPNDSIMNSMCDQCYDELHSEPEQEWSDADIGL